MYHSDVTHGDVTGPNRLYINMIPIPGYLIAVNALGVILQSIVWMNLIVIKFRSQAIEEPENFRGQVIWGVGL